MTAPDGVLLRTGQVFFRDAEITGLPQHRVGRLRKDPTFQQRFPSV